MQSFSTQPDTDRFASLVADSFLQSGTAIADNIFDRVPRWLEAFLSDLNIMIHRHHSVAGHFAIDFVLDHLEAFANGNHLTITHACDEVCLSPELSIRPFYEFMQNKLNNDSHQYFFLLYHRYSATKKLIDA